jgi:Domain of unknown function (DUF1844)
MNGSTAETGGSPAREEMMSALFANMVVQQSNMALMMLGNMPHPQTGETIRDVEAARMFIDQLEMLEFKTRGNLSKEEDRLLKQTLTGLRMAFVEAVESAAGSEPPAAGPGQPDKDQKVEEAGKDQAEAATSSDDSRKKFVKKY